MILPPRSRTSSALVLAILAVASAAQACEICAIYTSTEMQESRIGIRAGVAEQFTRFATLQRDGDEVANPHRERLESSITQLLVGYTAHPRFAVQLNLPVIHRSFRRLEESGVTSGTVSGVGDLTVSALATVWSRVNPRSVQRGSLLLGIKLPTGDPDRLREELGPDTSHDLDPFIPPPFRNRWFPRHSGTGMESGVHGHDLAMGTGSTDVLLGAHGLATFRRWYATGIVQYFIRTEGAFDYTFANELIVQGGPGYFLWLSHTGSLGLQSVLTLDTKGTDSVAGRRLGDTGATYLYAGPALHWTWGTQLTADLAADIPTVQNNTELQIVPDYRLRAGLVWRF